MVAIGWGSNRTVDYLPLPRSFELGLHISSTREMAVAVEFWRGSERIPGTICGILSGD